MVWRSALKRVWSIPRKSHGYLVHFISNSLPVQDIIRQRSLNFINKCLIHPSKLISAISTHGVIHNRCFFPLGLNYIICHSIPSYQAAGLNTTPSASFLCELISLREGSLTFSNDVNFLSYPQISEIISYICTN